MPDVKPGKGQYADILKLVCIALNALNELSVKLKKKNNVQQKTPSKDEERETALF